MTHTSKVLILDDRREYLRALQGALRGEFQVVLVTNLAEAKALLDDTFQVALVDVRLSETDKANRDGVRFLGWAKDEHPKVPIIMMSAYQDFPAAVEALNLGADFYLKKPIDIRELKVLLQQFAEQGTIPEKTEALRKDLLERRR